MNTIYEYQCRHATLLIYVVEIQTGLMILLNMLEKILALLLSLFSLVTNETPRVSFRDNGDTQEGNTDDDRWLPYVNEEYENVDTGKQLNSVRSFLINEDLPTGYNRISDGSSPERKSFGNQFGKPYLQVPAWHSPSFLLRHLQFCLFMSFLIQLIGVENGNITIILYHCLQYEFESLVQL